MVIEDRANKLNENKPKLYDGYTQFSESWTNSRGVLATRNSNKALFSYSILEATKSHMDLVGNYSYLFGGQLRTSRGLLGVTPI